MDAIQELLPGLEDFLTITLASENLSHFAEERRQFFIECLDIVKLPPSLPPREGRILPPELLKETEEVSGIPTNHAVPDFAATQREIARSLIDTTSYTEDVTDGAEIFPDKVVKLYDDIDPTECPQSQPVVIKQRPLSDIIKPNNTSDDDRDDNGESAWYEIPVARQQLTPENNNQSNGTDCPSITAADSTEELLDDLLDSTLTVQLTVPPPLPPRKDIKFSDSGSRHSINFEEKPPVLPFRPPLPKRNELCTPTTDKSDPSEKSNNSDPELSGDGDSTSYESFDEDEQHDTDLSNKLSIQLPKIPKKRIALKKSKKLSKSRSSSQWEISAPFRKLENIDISGELFYRGKLKWNRRTVAISNGCLAMYKPDKDVKPSLVIPLTGYEASVSEREGRRGYEVKMVHPNADSHSFSVDFKEWALLWVEHINGSAKGQAPPKYHTHLARSFSTDVDTNTNATTFGSKTDLNDSNSNVSTASEGGSEDSAKVKSKGNRVMRMGSFAFRATQFFENIGKKTTSKKKSHNSSGPSFRHSGDFTDVRNHIDEEPSFSSATSAGNLARSRKNTTSDSNLPSIFSRTDNLFSLPPASAAVSDVKLWQSTDSNAFLDVIHKGYLHIFSSFNKRRWGKRWCLVRDNMFECYKNDSSKQCELNFLLRNCVLRRAVVETSSENGLMIMEAGKEKITVEPLSREEMGRWVRVLLSETSTKNIPEGLEEFLKEPKSSDSDRSSITSFTVLKQWNMDCLVPNKHPSVHDYEDPVETSLAVAKLEGCDLVQPKITSASTTDLNSNSTSGVAHTPANLAYTTNKTNISLPVYNKNKHTTDSGFYSTKGTNSDSDSSPEVGDLDFQCAAQENFCSAPHSATLSKGVSSCSSGTEKTDHLFKDTKTLSSHNLPDQSSQSFNLSPSSSSLSLGTQKSQHLMTSTSESQLNINGNSHFHDNNFPFPPNTLNLSLRHSNSASTVNTSGQSQGPNLSILSPSGEEYSIVLKKSERGSRSPVQPSSVSSCTELTSSNSLHFTSLDHDENSVNKDIIIEGFPNAIQYSATANDNESSYYEPVCAHFPEGDGEQKRLNGITKSPHIAQSSIQECDVPPPLPTSPVPDLVSLKSFSFDDSQSDGHSEIDVSHLSSNSGKHEVPSSAGAVSSSKQKTRSNDPKFSSLIVNHSSTDETRVTDTDEVFIKCESLMSPTPDRIAALINNPNATPNELKDLTDKLKHKQAEIKRKRLAIHEQRQRVLSDEKRLAFEKEFAALEKAAQATEKDIRVVQNHLDVIQNKTPEAKKAGHGKHKTLSKMKKTKHSKQT